MIHLDIQHRGDRGIEIEEGIHILAGFKDEVFAAADAVRAVDGGQLRPRNDRWVGARRKEDLGGHGGGRALAVHAGEPDAMRVAAHQIAEVIGARNDRQPLGARADKLGRIVAHGDGVDQCVIAVEMRRIVPAEDLDALLCQPLGQRRERAIRAADAKALRFCDMRQRRHGDAADAEKIDRLFAVQHARDFFGAVMCV